MCKKISIVLIFVLIFTFIGCNKKGNNNTITKQPLSNIIDKSNIVDQLVEDKTSQYKIVQGADPAEKYAAREFQSFVYQSTGAFLEIIDEEDVEKNENYSRKLRVDLFIDDRNIGGLPDWGTIYQMINEHKSYKEVLDGQRSMSLDDVEDDRPRRKWWQIR